MQDDATHWYALTIDDVTHKLDTDISHGLTTDDVSRRLQQFGPNLLPESRQVNCVKLFFSQFASTLVVILVAACAVSALLHDYIESLAILVIVILNAMLAFLQEYRAEKAMAALRTFATPMVSVRRDGRLQAVSSQHLVPGDIMLLEAGNIAQADCRLTESMQLRMQEAVLTGESDAVDKISAPLPDQPLPIADRHNMIYMGSTVSYGRGEGVVTATGMQTELGQVAALLQSVQADKTPLQRRLAHLGHSLTLAIMVIVAVVAIIGGLRGTDLRLVFLTAMSLAVAAIPEGLPAVVTITLALGAQRMLMRNALIRKLPAVETLGSVNVICSDKTGTLTQNRMRVVALQTPDGHFDLLSVQLDKQTQSEPPFAPAQPVKDSAALGLLLAGGALCNDATLSPQADGAPDRIAGEPTECALVDAAQQFGIRKTELETIMPRVAELPFDATRKRMTTVHHAPSSAQPLTEALRGTTFESACAGSSRYVAFTKGAADSLLDISSFVWKQGECQPLQAADRQDLMAANDALAARGMRVLGVACRRLDALPRPEMLRQIEQDLIIIGLIGMIDPPRHGVRQSVQTCKQAAIRPVMITGDHPLTAQFIAQELGISDHTALLSGQQLSQLSDQALEQQVDRVAVYARVTPEDKLRIVQALQKRGQIVAMTGDGVNDAPALRKADIGVAMGLTGTDVAKQASDMVLLDDNFLTIVDAVKEGRVIYDNIRKFIKYTLTSNTGEIWVMLLAPFFHLPLPLLPLQILWINLLTDGLPGLALALEPAEPDVMQRTPHHPGQSIFSGGFGRDILWVGLLMGCIPLLIGYGYRQAGNPAWQTMLFTTLTLLQMGNVLALRCQQASLFRVGLWSNKPLVIAVGVTLVLQMAVIYLPTLQTVFKTVHLSIQDMILALSVSTLVFWCVELQKWLQRRRA